MIIESFHIIIAATQIEKLKSIGLSASSFKNGD